MLNNISKAYEDYIETVFQMGIDYNFWSPFLKSSVEKFQKENNGQEGLIKSLFGAYDIDIKSNSGLLKIYEKVKSISCDDLNNRRVNLLTKVINNDLVRIYIAVEEALIQTIWDKDFPNFPNPDKNKKNIVKIQTKIRETLRHNSESDETKNNRHLIKYLSLNSPEYQAFLSRPIRTDLSTNWANFYELISILRNIISHTGSKVNNDTLNEIRSKANDIFERHFTIFKDSNGGNQIIAYEERIPNLLNIINDFTLNTIKIARGESSFEFLKMK
jgi:hypothetical protein